MKKCYTIFIGLFMVCSSALGQNQRLIFNEILADPAGDLTGDANGDGIRSSKNDEFVELANVSSDTLDMTGWMLGDDEAINFTFPAGYLLPPRRIIVIFGGGDITNVTGYDPDLLLTRVFSADSTVGNGIANGGEYLVIKSADGTEDTYIGYGSKVGGGAPDTPATAGITFEFGGDITVAANQNVSVTRSPDGNTESAEPWVQHTTVSSALFSPGLTVDGAPDLPKKLPTLSIIINEILADPPSGSAGDANGDGTRSSSRDEFVELANVSDAAVDISGWRLGDDEGIGFTFPNGYVVQPRSFVVVFGGGDVTGAFGYDADPMKTRVFSADSTIGNGLANGGEIVLLMSDDGAYDTWLAYGSKSGTGGPPNADAFEIGIDVGAPANADNSITRFPDGNINVIDPFVQHLTVSNNAYSPGKTSDGRTQVPPPQPPITVVINEILADVSGAGDANGDGTTDTFQDQFIEVVNTSETESVDLSGWGVGDGSSVTFTFPNGYTLAPQAFAVVFGGGDLSAVPGFSADQMLTRVFSTSGGVLGDGLTASGDFAVLTSDDGVYDSYVAFGSKSGSGDPSLGGSSSVEWEFALSTSAAADQSDAITRSPDGNILASDPFVNHLSVSTNRFSPSQTINGVNALDDFIDVPHPWGTGYALHFNWWERDRLEIRDAASLVPLQMDQGTVEMWFRPDSALTNDTHPPDFTYLFGKNLSGNKEGDLGLAWRRGEGRLLFFMQDGVSTTNLESSNRVEDVFFPRWYHVAVTWNVADSMRIFIDGKKVAAIESTVPLLGGNQTIAIGNGAADLWNDRFEGFRGMIDEVRFSVVERYTSDFTLQTSPFETDNLTLALWHFDEGSGDTAADVTGNGFLGSFGGNGSDGLPDVNSAPSWVDITTLVAKEELELPERFTLSPNYPNPFNPTTIIEYTVPRVSKVQLSVYNLLGQRVQVLVNESRTPGRYSATFNANNLASGLYFYTLIADRTNLVGKMMLVK
jgi:Concanavalin A-like lectin/glucanases superfamily/Lamin Tail Domain/Secretion system C-terminal sorting domain